MASISQINSLHDHLSKQILPKSQEVQNHHRQFLNKEIKSYESINNQNDHVLEKIKKEWSHYNKIVNDFKAKDNRDKKFIEGSDLYLKAKEDQIESKGKILESFNAGIKETVSKIKPQKLALLPLEKENKLVIPFETLYQILYHKPKKTFKWLQFKQKALILDDGEDFITRLANINFKGLTTFEYDELRKLKNDQEFKDISENSVYAIDIVDLADWVDYVVEGHKLALQKKQTEYEYEKIKNDKGKRSDGSLKMKIQFCSETLSQYDSYQTNLMSLQSQILTIIASFKNNVTEINDNALKRKQKIKEINSL